MDIATLRKQAADAKETADRLHKAVDDAEYVAAQAALEPLKALAEKAHDILCRWNHTDGCGWGYEQDSKTGAPHWDGWAHRRWLTHIAAIVNPDRYSREKPIPAETISALLDKVVELKQTHPDAIWLIRHRLEP